MNNHRFKFAGDSFVNFIGRPLRSSFWEGLGSDTLKAGAPRLNL